LGGKAMSPSHWSHAVGALLRRRRSRLRPGAFCNLLCEQAELVAAAGAAPPDQPYLSRRIIADK